jgi:biofilm PGA synthesis protein PgaD
VWLAFLYLIKDAFIDLYLLGTETFGWVFLHADPPDLPTFFGFLSTLSLYGLIAILNGAILMGWAFYNQVRFRGRETRHAIAAVSPADLGKLYGVSAEQVVEWQSLPAVVIRHDADGTVLAVVPESTRSPELADLGTR